VKLASCNISVHYEWLKTSGEMAGCLQQPSNNISTTITAITFTLMQASRAKHAQY